MNNKNLISDKLCQIAWEKTNEAILFLDEKGIIFDCNPASLTIFGCESKEELIGKGPLDFSPPQQPDGKTSALKGKIIFKETLRRGYLIFDWVHVRKDRTQIHTEIILNAVELEGKKVMIAFIRDITGRKRTQEECMRLRQIEAIGTMAGGIAHDFNNILNAIIGSAELLYSRIKDSNLRYWIEVIFNQSQKGAELVRQLLDFARRSHVEAKPFNIRPLIKEVVKMLKNILPENIEISFNYTPRKDYIVEISPTDLQEIILNLASNARDAMPEGGRLQIELSLKRVEGNNIPPGDYVVLSVQDTGMGMSNEVLERCLDPFFTTKPQGKGTGMGLTHVYGLVKQHKGYIHIKTKEGKGTTVEIFFPALKATEINKISSLKEATKETSFRKTLLVIEDDETVLEVIKGILQSMGCRILTARNGKEGLEIYKKAYPNIDLVISDIVMPKLDGMSFYKEAKKLNPNLKALFITGYSIKNFIREIDGKFEILPKPIISSELIKKVEGLLQNRSGENNA